MNNTKIHSFGWEEGTMPFHEFRAVPLLHRCLNPSDGSPEKAS